jgi:Ca2+-binding EF-hand superfamily protein
MSKERLTKVLLSHGIEGHGILMSLFDIFDADKSGWIDFKEFCVGVSLFSTGKFEETIEIVFNFYDLDGNDEITKEEMIEALCAFNKVLQLKEIKFSSSYSAPSVRIFVSSHLQFSIHALSSSSS